MARNCHRDIIHPTRTLHCGIFLSFSELRSLGTEDCVLKTSFCPQHIRFELQKPLLAEVAMHSMMSWPTRRLSGLTESVAKIQKNLYSTKNQAFFYSTCSSWRVNVWSFCKNSKIKVHPRIILLKQTKIPLFITFLPVSSQILCIFCLKNSENELFFGSLAKPCVEYLA